MSNALARALVSRAPLILCCFGVVLLGGLVLNSSIANRLSSAGLEDRHSESFRTYEQVRSAIGHDPQPKVVVLARARRSVLSPGVRSEVVRVQREIAADARVGSVGSLFSTNDRDYLSQDGRSTYLLVRFRSQSQDVVDASIRRIRPMLRSPTVDFKLGGDGTAFLEWSEIARSDLLLIEALVLPVLFVLLIVLLRGLAPALIPLAAGFMSIAVALLVVRVLDSIFDVSVFALNITTFLGLGLGIDYSLLMLFRYREEYRRTPTMVTALATTLATAGRTVAVSGLTVAAIMATLLLFPQRFVYSIGLGGALVALAAAAVALLLVPALIAVLGNRVLGKSRVGRFDGGWQRLSAAVAAHPGRAAGIGLVVLTALALPLLGAQFRYGDQSELPSGSSARQVEQSLRSDFTRVPTAPIVVASQTGPQRLRAVRARARDGAPVASVGPLRTIGATSYFESTTAGSPYGQASARAVEFIRASGQGDVTVGGAAAEFIDLKHSIADHFPLAIGVALVASFVIVFLLTGSLVLPACLLIFNALTIVATFGLVQAIFGGIYMTTAMLLFALAWGLSTDYGIFLVTRIGEGRKSGGTESASVVAGLRATGRLITVAALLLCVVLGALTLSSSVFVAQVGLGAALAVAIDVSIVRALVAPGVLCLLGARAWWSPASLLRLRAKLARLGPPARAVAVPSGD